MTMKIYNIEHFKAGQLENREDEIAQEILDHIADNLKTEGIVALLDPNDALGSRVKYPINNLIERLGCRYTPFVFVWRDLDLSTDDLRVFRYGQYPYIIED